MTDAIPAWEFSATGTRWRLYHSGGLDDNVAAAIAAAIERDEARWSRFRPDSEISELNRTAGEWRALSAETVELLEACADWTRRTDGIFQPLIGRALTAWGYAGSITERTPFVHVTPSARPVTGTIAFDHDRGRVSIPPGTTVDLGGIGKGWIAARAASLMTELCTDRALLIDAGGDLLAVTGAHVVAVENPERPTDAAREWIRLAPGQAVATSGYGRRRWTNGDGHVGHHLIDPRTGAPGALVHATVVADDPVSADITAKVLALRPESIRTCRYPALLRVPEHTITSRAWTDVSADEPPRGGVDSGWRIGAHTFCPGGLHVLEARRVVFRDVLV